MIPYYGHFQVKIMVADVLEPKHSLNNWQGEQIIIIFLEYSMFFAPAHVIILC